MKPVRPCLVILLLAACLVLPDTASANPDAVSIGEGSVFTVKKEIPIASREKQVVLSAGSAGSTDWWTISSCVLKLKDDKYSASTQKIPANIELKVKKSGWVNDASGLNNMRVLYEFEENGWVKSMDCEGGVWTRMQVNNLKVANVQYQLGEYISIASTVTPQNTGNAANTAGNSEKTLVDPGLAGNEPGLTPRDGKSAGSAAK